MLAGWGFLLGGFFLFRLVFFLIYNSDFDETGALQILGGFVHGLRFDLSVIFALTGLPTLLFLLVSPLPWRRSMYWVLFGYIVLAAMFMYTITGIDLFYFAFVKRRLSFELFAMLNDWRPVLALIMDGFWAQVLAVGVVFFGLLFIVARLFRRWVLRPWRPVVWWSQIAQLALLFLITFFLVRGGLQTKPLSVGMAFRSPNMAVGHLTLNPVFTSLRGALRNKAKYLSYYSDIEAVRTTQTLLERDGAGVKGKRRKAYPLLRRQENPPPRKKKNLVILVVESFSAQFVGALGSKLGVTPTLDRLTGEGLLFSEFYASGTRSLEGVATIVTGFPALPTGTLIGGAFQQNAVSSLPLILKEQGYSSLFLHGAFKGSMWFDSFSQRIGFGRFISKEDFPDAESKSDSAWGIFDQYALERFHREVAASPKPFFAYYFSLSPHTPFELPDKRFRKFGAEIPNAPLLNGVAYADFALGRFFELARKSDYWRDTVFIITADHNMGGATLNNRERMWIPLLILDPGNPNFPRGVVNPTLGSQVDIAPTALDLLGITTENAFIGKSLLRPGATRFAMFGWGNQAGWLSANGLLVHDTEKPVAWYPLRPEPGRPKGLSSGLPPPRDLPETRALQSYLQALNNLLLDNRLAPSR